MYKTITKYFVYGNVWVSLNVLFLTATTYLSIDERIDLSLLSFAFFSTLLAYNFQRVYKFTNLDKNSLRNRWLLTHKNLLYLLSLVGFLGTLISFLFLPFEVWGLLIIPSVLSVFYVVPVNKKHQAFRDLPFFKIYLIAISWVFVSVIIPVIMNDMTWKDTLGLSFEKVLFVVALTIPFDIRDMKFDSQSKRTIPQLLGLKKSLYLAVFFLLLSGVIAFWLFQEGVYNVHVLWAILGSYLISMVVVLKTNLQRKELFYTGIIDGLFFVQFVLVWLFLFFLPE